MNAEPKLIADIISLDEKCICPASVRAFDEGAIFYLKFVYHFVIDGFFVDNVVFGLECFSKTIVSYFLIRVEEFVVPLISRRITCVEVLIAGQFVCLDSIAMLLFFHFLYHLVEDILFPLGRN